jgi:hypothetical protein
MKHMKVKLPLTNKKLSAASESFGSGADLEGMFYNGKEIGSLSTRKFIVCIDGTKVSRKGTRIEYYETDWDKIKSVVNVKGYKVYKSFSAGTNSSYSYVGAVGICWESEESVYIYLYNKIMSDGTDTAT